MPRPIVDEKLCTGCEQCVNVCPMGVFEMKEKEVNGEKKRVSVVVAPDKCINCKACETTCPAGAIKVVEEE